MLDPALAGFMLVAFHPRRVFLHGIVAGIRVFFKSPSPAQNCVKKFQASVLVHVLSPPPEAAVDPSTGAGV